MTYPSNPSRKPRIALMGEFSAGKSTLSNLLLGSRPLPEKVTATRLSPVWLAHGMQPPYRVDVNGLEQIISLDDLESIPVEETRVIRLFFEADILEVCDLIDFPGISDPNMSSEVWQRVLDEVDAVLWCTHATQAWRQSEAAVWETIPEAVKKRSALLITRFDKLTTDRDKRRVLARVKRETEGEFGATFPISLTEALAAGDDFEAFDKSGAGAFLEHLITLVGDLTKSVDGLESSLYFNAMAETLAEPADMEANVEHGAPAPADVAPEAPAPMDELAPGVTIMPKRVPVAPRRPEAPSSPDRVRAQRPASSGKVVDMSSPRLEPQVAPRNEASKTGSDLGAIFKDGDGLDRDSASG